MSNENEINFTKKEVEALHDILLDWAFMQGQSDTAVSHLRKCLLQAHALSEEEARHLLGNLGFGE